MDGIDDPVGLTRREAEIVLNILLSHAMSGPSALVDGGVELANAIRKLSAMADAAPSHLPPPPGP